MVLTSACLSIALAETQVKRQPRADKSCLIKINKCIYIYSMNYTVPPTTMAKFKLLALSFDILLQKDFFVSYYIFIIKFISLFLFVQF